MTANTVPAARLHRFQEAGLGLAPFACIGVEERRGPITLADGTRSGAPGQPMGTCAYCGTGIAECFCIQSSDGRLFIVGCECVKKTGDSGLRVVVEEHIKTIRRQQRARRQEVKLQAARDRMNDPATQSDLKALPHPHAGLAADGKTAFDYITYIWDVSGSSGRARIGLCIDSILSPEAVR